MKFFGFRPQNRVRPTRTSRTLRPGVESFEPRQLLSSATISGTAFNDLTGNGYSHDDTPRAGVTIDLYQKGSSTVLESTSSNKNGTFSFTNLTPGSYSLKQVGPANSIATEALNGYTVSLKSGQDLANQNFDDFQLLPKPVLSQLHYTITTPAGQSSTFSTLDGHIQQGDTVTASFDLKTSEELTLVAYTAPNGDFNTSNLQGQIIFSQASTSGTGTKTLTVTVPDGYFQVDFVAGPAIDHLATNSNVYYHAQDRFIDGQQGGTHADPLTTTTTTTTAPVVLEITAQSDVVSPDTTVARKH